MADAGDVTAWEGSDDVLGAAAIALRLIRGRQEREPVSAQFVEHWWAQPDDVVEEVLHRRTETFRVRRQVAFLLAERSAYAASEQGDPDQLRRMWSALVHGIYLIGVSHDEAEAAQNACIAAARTLTTNRKHQLKRQVVRAAKELPDDGDFDGGLFEAVGVGWDELTEIDQMIRRALSPAAVLPRFAGVGIPDAADALADVAERRQPSTSTPVYDTQDAERRVMRVELQGFRGAPAPLTVDFTAKDRPVSALVFGDNGVGKSTLADGIEFALQGRIGRSVNFDGPLTPSAASFAVDTTPVACVTLDDGSVVERSLVERDDQKFVPHGDNPRPGFRLAPITLKRQDILRFLDTDALARGHVFFDYFPTSADDMAIRPEEQLQLLDDEAYKLRVARQALIAKVAASLGIEPTDLPNRNALIGAIQRRLLDGQTFHQAQTSGQWDEVDESTRVPVQQLLEVFGRLTSIKKEKQKGVQTLNPVAYREQAAAIGAVLDGVGDHLTTAFRRITGATHVERIEVIFGGSGPVSLDVVLVLSSGKRCFPQQIFSEGYRDLVAILFFALMARRAAEQGQAKLLILDDVFQSVDATVRSATVEYLLTEFSDWQLIFTVHDRLWFEQLRNAFQRHQHRFVERELRRWTFDGGPVTAVPSELTTALERELRDGDASTICATAGRTLEQISDQLSSRLGTSVVRRYGDKYTLGDLWPGVRKALKRTRADDVAAEIDQLYSLRNLAGAHYNEFAETLSQAEAERFGDAVIRLAALVWCRDCHDWISRSGATIGCRAGHLTIS